VTVGNGSLPKLAIVGAAGTVGTEIVELIQQRHFDHAELKLFGSGPSAENAEIESDERLDVSELKSASDLSESDIVFLAIPPEPAAAIVAEQHDSTIIDLSAANRPVDTTVPLVAPGLISRERIIELKPMRLFGIPHPAAQVIAAVLGAIGVAEGFVGATVMLGASIRGRDAVSALFNQSVDLLNARLNLADDETQSAFNLFEPREAGALAEVIAAQAGQLAGGSPKIAVEVVHAPVFHGAAVAMFLPSSNQVPDWRGRLRAAPGFLLAESGDTAGVIEGVGQEAVIVKMTVSAAGVALWCVFDAARTAALSAVWVAETVSA
jgi:aspartate-semialdehyde dehydrogenase